MKKYMSMSLMMAFVTMFSLCFTSCGDDDDDTPVAAPSIEIEEANIEGDELCCEADIEAPGKTAAITIAIYDASGKTLKVNHFVTGNKYIGVLNIPGFHVHVDILGKGVEEGDLMRLTVVDANGNSTTKEKIITEEEDDDEDEDHD